MEIAAAEGVRLSGGEDTGFDEDGGSESDGAAGGDGATLGDSAQNVPADFYSLTMSSADEVPLSPNSS